MAVYTHKNALGAKVFDVDTGRELTFVLSVDTGAGVVVSAAQPIRLADDKGSVVTETANYRRVYAINGVEQRPALFHCYGRLS